MGALFIGISILISIGYIAHPPSCRVRHSSRRAWHSRRRARARRYVAVKRSSGTAIFKTRFEAFLCALLAFFNFTV